MVTLVTKIFTFEACHSLPYHKGQCANLHGHSYKLEVTVEGTPSKMDGDENCGMLIDFADIKGAVKSLILDHVDHANLNSIYFNPTAELMCKDFYKKLQSWFSDKTEVNLFSVRLWETATCYAEVREG